MDQPIFNINVVENKTDFAQVEIEPLEQGFGHTVGNALRRTLLSSIKGAAASQIKIEGVKHQFSTLKGMKEDVVDFTLNIKRLRIKYQGEDSIEVHLDEVGPKTVTAADIIVPAGVEIVNKDLVLAHLSDEKSKLKATIKIDTGYGYRLSQDQKVSTVGIIPLDSAFSPILRVKFDVKETRVGHRTDFDKLILKIWSDGTVEIEDALKQASETLLGFFNQIVNPIIPEKVEEIEENTADQEALHLTVEELDLPTRIANALRKGGYATVGDLVKATKEEIAKVKNLGNKSVNIVIEKVLEKGVEFENK